MTDRRESSFENGTYRHFEALDYLRGSEAKIATDIAKYAVDRYMSEKNPLFEQLEIMLNESDHAIHSYESEGETRFLSVVTNPPKEIDIAYPRRIWVKTDEFEHENCYLGIGENAKSPAFVNFKSKKMQPADVDLLEKEMKLFILVSFINIGAEPASKANV